MSFNLREAAAMLGIKVRTLRLWIERGKITAEKDASGRWKISMEEVERVKR